MTREMNTELARLLLNTQFPQWSDLTINPVDSSGTANVLFRLGETMVMRFPRSIGAAQAIDKEWKWLPQLATDADDIMFHDLTVS